MRAFTVEFTHLSSLSCEQVLTLKPQSRVHSSRTEVNTELTCTKLTQLHDALLVTRVGVTKLIGCRAAVRELNFSSVQFDCCEHGLTVTEEGQERARGQVSGHHSICHRVRNRR